MSDQMTTQDSLPPYRVADLPQNRPTRFELRPGPQQLAAIASQLGLSALRKMVFKGEIRSSGRKDWVLEAHLGATVVQPCVVTLAPVTTRVETDVERRYLADLALTEGRAGEDDSGEIEVEMPEDDSAEALGSHIDVQEVMVEALSLAMPLYPRADDAALDEAVFTEPGKQAMTDEAARPFAGLAGLRDQLAASEGKSGDEE